MDFLITVPLIPAGYYNIGYIFDTRHGVDVDTADNSHVINNVVRVLPP